MTSLNPQTIGKKIAEARKKMNISQAQLAGHLFISSQAVGKWERGESMPDIITFNRLAEILNVDLNYFSESKHVADIERTPDESTIKQSDESPSGSQEKKLSWNMSLGNWMSADFSGLKGLHEKFSSSNMQGCKFIGSDLSGLLLKNNNVESCDFSGSDISNSRIQGSNLAKNLFKDSSLNGTNIFGSNIDSCDFTGANFTGTKFSKSYIYGCVFVKTDFTGVVIESGGFSGVKSTDLKKSTLFNAAWNRSSFIDTHIADLVFTGMLEDCYFENCKFTRVIFQNAILINTFFKNNRNLSRVQFTDCKVDRITYEFLKQGKADLTDITLLTSKGENEQ